MKIVVIGIGSMGCLFAVRLSPLTSLTMVGAWSAQIEEINNFGIRLIELDGLETHRNVRVVKSVEEIEPADLALILVKTWQTERAAFQANQILTKKGFALTLQNGLGNRETIANIVGADRTLLGITSEGAMVVKPGIVRHAGIGETYLSGPTESQAKIIEVQHLFQTAGFKAEIVENPDSLVWGKLAVNAAINPLTALLQVPNGFLNKHKTTRTIMAEAAAEVEKVAQALGISLPYQSATERAIEVSIATASNLSSMAQDIARGAPTEIEAITGNIVRYGDRYQLLTPVNSALYHLVKAQIESSTWHDAIWQLPPEMQRLFSKLVTLGGRK